MRPGPVTRVRGKKRGPPSMEPVKTAAQAPGPQPSQLRKSRWACPRCRGHPRVGSGPPGRAGQGRAGISLSYLWLRVSGQARLPHQQVGPGCSSGFPALGSVPTPSQQSCESPAAGGGSASSHSEGWGRGQEARHQTPLKPPLPGLPPGLAWPREPRGPL